MTDELKQIADDLQNALGDHLSLGDEYRKILAALAEVQRQTVEAAAKIAETIQHEHETDSCKSLRGPASCAEDIVTAIRSLLSPAQEVRNG